MDPRLREDDTKNMIKSYYELTKPGLIYGNIVTLAAGFALALRGGNFIFLLLIPAFLGLALVIASGCVLNNVIDRDIDSRMERTKSRATVTGAISKRNSIIYGVILGLAGFAILVLYTNLLTAGVALAGFIVYVGIYSPMKTRSAHAALVGSFAGAVPPVVGYAAASGRLDAGAFILFAMLVLWQMPHFYAIAIRRQEDYAAAKVPVMPARKGIRSTKIQMLLYIIAFIAAALMLPTFGYAGPAYLALALILGAAWLALCIRGFWICDHREPGPAPSVLHTTIVAFNTRNSAWAKQMFSLSLAVLMTICIAIIVRL
ncbi:MAG TPA: heme o synthase [Candidatus Paceibacterota bacterium]|nr:heme o synthase [Candidatus Paceibacterota bacterium]